MTVRHHLTDPCTPIVVSSESPAVQVTVDDGVIGSLVERIAGHDAGALVALHHQCSAHVLTEIRQHLAVPAACQIVLQATFVEIWRLASRHRIAPGNAQRWICAIANRRAKERGHLIHINAKWHPGAVFEPCDGLNRIELAEIFTAAHQRREHP